MLKFKRCLIGQELTWIADCSGLTKFFETDHEAAHAIQRWKLELLQLNFTIAHLPGRMLTDCDVLWRRNTWTNQWRKEEETVKRTSKQQRKEGNPLPAALLAMISADDAERPPPIPRTHVIPKLVGANTVNVAGFHVQWSSCIMDHWNRRRDSNNGDDEARTRAAPSTKHRRR
jgi:hypothetical protein